MTGANWAGLGLNVGQTSELLSAAVICGDQTLGCDSATDVGIEDFSLVAFVLACLTQGDADTRWLVRAYSGLWCLTPLA